MKLSPHVPLISAQKHFEEKKILEELIYKKDAKLKLLLKKLALQKMDKEQKAAELISANLELVINNEEKKKRAEELLMANIEVAFQNEEKTKRAAELIIANIELTFQNEEKRKRAAELVIANIELAFQNKEKGNRAAELLIADIQLAFEAKEKELRAEELILNNKAHDLEILNADNKAKELSGINKELEQFAYVASHDLLHPLRTVSNYMGLFEEKYFDGLDKDAKRYLVSVQNATKRMSALIKSLLNYSQVGHNAKLKTVDCKHVIEDVLADLDSLIKSSGASIHVLDMPTLNIYEIELRQVFQNLVTNAIKFTKTGTAPEILITCEKISNSWQFAVSDNGIGIEKVYFEKIFDIFQRLNSNSVYEGSGIGLANCKKIIQLHLGQIWLESKIDEGSKFYFTIPIINT